MKNKEYIYKLIKNSGISKQEIASELGITYNNLNLKFSGHVNLYLQECIKLSYVLNIHFDDLFNPDDTLQKEVLFDHNFMHVREYPKNLEYCYNVNSLYIKKLIYSRDLTLEETLVQLWKVTRVSIYYKLQGSQKIKLSEGLLLCDKLNMSVYDIFCKSNIDIVKYISQNSY